MTTEYKLNQLIEWTKKDRAKGVCPVPAGSDVTMWLAGGTAVPVTNPQHWEWGECEGYITAYLIHSVPREPIVGWLIVGGRLNIYWYAKKENAEHVASEYGGRVVKMVEEME